MIAATAILIGCSATANAQDQYQHRQVTRTQTTVRHHTENTGGNYDRNNYHREGTYYGYRHQRTRRTYYHNHRSFNDNHRNYNDDQRINNDDSRRDLDRRRDDIR